MNGDCIKVYLQHMDPSLINCLQPLAAKRGPRLGRPASQCRAVPGMAPRGDEMDAAYSALGPRAPPTLKAKLTCDRGAARAGGGQLMS
ncbi:hypothetical protein CC85DRAFT_288266, partial [Cutaneotrichosporon oleaginosum]